MSVLDVIAATLAETREVNGGELESVLTIYTPEGLAHLIFVRLHAQGFDIVPTEQSE